VSSPQAPDRTTRFLAGESAVLFWKGKDHMRRSLAFLGVSIFLGVSMLSCDSGGPDQSRMRWNERLAAFEQARVDQYDAIRFPPQSFAGRRVFMLNLQSLLMNQDGRPILFNGFLEDITREEGQFYVHFTSRLSNEVSDRRTVQFHLRCGYDDVRALLEKPPEHDSVSRYLFLRGIRKDFLVVAGVENVERVAHYEVVGHSSEGSEKVDLEIQAPDTFSADGELVSMVKYSEIPELGAR
jgi:hypothetical protein